MAIAGKKINRKAGKVAKCLKIMQNASLKEIEDLIIELSEVRKTIIESVKNSPKITIEGKKANELHGKSKDS